MALGGHTTFNMTRAPMGNTSKTRTGNKADSVDVRRHVERLMLRLDFNGGFSKFSWGKKENGILGDL